MERCSIAWKDLVWLNIIAIQALPDASVVRDFPLKASVPAHSCVACHAPFPAQQ